MKFNKLFLFTFIFVFAGFLLTACQDATSHITDQNGKEISVTTSDDTYTFKLPAVKIEEVDSSESEEPVTTILESEITENNAKEPLESEGPKTGEP